MPMQQQTTQERLKAVLARIDAAAREAGRDPSSVQLLASVWIVSARAGMCG